MKTETKHEQLLLSVIAIQKRCI